MTPKVIANGSKMASKVAEEFGWSCKQAMPLWFLFIEARLSAGYLTFLTEWWLFSKEESHGSGSQRVRMWKVPILLKSGVEIGTVLLHICSIGHSVRDQRADLRGRDHVPSSRWDAYQVTWRNVLKPPHFSAMNVRCFHSDVSFHCGKIKQ